MGTYTQLGLLHSKWGHTHDDDFFIQSEDKIGTNIIRTFSFKVGIHTRSFAFRVGTHMIRDFAFKDFALLHIIEVYIIKLNCLHCDV